MKSTDWLLFGKISKGDLSKRSRDDMEGWEPLFWGPTRGGMFMGAAHPWDPTCPLVSLFRSLGRTPFHVGFGFSCKTTLPPGFPIIEEVTATIYSSLALIHMP